jgi:hypothetical protein
MNLLIRLSSILLFCIILVAGSASADWPCRTDVTVPVVTDTGNQWNVRMASDGKHGVIAVWQDRRDGVYDKLFTQRVSGTGNVLWTSGGVRIAQTPGYQYYPQILSDNTGGAYIAWQDNRSGVDYDIYIQHVDSHGNFLWTPSGVAVCNATGQQYNPQLAPDGSGGVVVVWQDRRSGEFDIYAQRYSSLGTQLWTSNGVLMNSSAGDQVEPEITGDGTGGAFVAWTDYRNTSTLADIYAQHIRGSDGTPLWNNGGVAVCVTSNTQKYPQVVSDGAGGTIIAWQDRRDGLTDNIYAQRLDASGIAQWTMNGVQAAPSSGLQYYPRMESDAAGGAVLVWQENRIGGEYDIYAQRLGSLGQRLWASTGLPVCTAIGNQLNPVIVVQTPSILIAWQDFRSQTDYNVYIQRLTLTGQAQWSADGIPVALIPYNQVVPQVACDSLSGAIVSWVDFRSNNGTSDIQSQRVGANGMIGGGCFRTFSQDSLGLKSVRYRSGRYRILAMPNPGDVRDSVFHNGAFVYDLTVGIKRTDSSRAYGWATFTRSIFVRNALPQTIQPRAFDYFPSRKYLGKLINPNLGRYNNRLLGEMLALKINIGASDLGMTQQQLGDLVYSDSIVNNPLNGKRIRAIALSVDSMMTYYKHYPGIDYGIICSSLHRINTAFEGKMDTLSAIPLKVKPVRSLFSVSYLLPSADPPTVLPRFEAVAADQENPTQFVLNQNYPNPFNPSTTIEFILPEPSIVTLRIYNVLGQEIAHPITRQLMDDGQQAIQFDGSRLSTGVYFYQLVAEPENGGALQSQVRKMMLLR